MTIHERLVRIPSSASPEYIDAELERALLYRFPGAEVERVPNAGGDTPEDKTPGQRV